MCAIDDIVGKEKPHLVGHVAKTAGVYYCVVFLALGLAMAFLTAIGRGFTASL
jgi:hypothetical protein